MWNVGFSAFAPSFDNQIKHGNEKEIENGGHNHATEDCGSHRVATFLSGAMGSHKCPECKGKGTWTCVVCKGQTPKCVNCKGTGNDPQTFSTCMTCGGKGTAQVCYNCKGTWKKACPKCGGSGSVNE